MSSLADLPELIGFFSYSRDDDDDSQGALSELRDRIQRELRGQLGRSRSTLRIWQDKEAIAPGKLWESEIGAALEGAVFFIPIVTPTTVKSDYCKHEFESFLARERALGRTDLIFPIYYIRVPTLEREADWRSDPLLSIIAKRQWVDWRELRLLAAQETMVREAVAEFCGKIVETLQRRDALTEQAQAEAVRARAHASSEQAQVGGPTSIAGMSSERDGTRGSAETAPHQDDAPASRTGVKDERDKEETAKEQAAGHSSPPTLLDALWPETERNRDHRHMAFVARIVLAFLAAIIIVDAGVLLFRPSSFMLVWQPALVAISVVFIAVTLWPGKPRSRLLRYPIIVAVAVAAFTLMYQGQHTTYYLRSGYTLLANTILYFGIVAAWTWRVTLPLVLLSVLAFVALGFIWPASFLDVLSMHARLLVAGEILAEGMIFAGAVALGWGSPPIRMIAAAFLINLAETLWVGFVHDESQSAFLLLIASVASALGTAAVVERAWRSAGKHSAVKHSEG
jgi:hypothetical protein